jgi:hypothetical protein
LLEAGANPLLRDNTGLNAIEWAERKGLPDVAKLLRDRTQSHATLKNKTTPEARSTETRKIVTGNQQPKRVSPDVVSDRPLSDDEKSRRWIAGLKQRLDEKANREARGAPGEPLRGDDVQRKADSPQGPKVEPKVGLSDEFSRLEKPTASAEAIANEQSNKDEAVSKQAGHNAVLPAVSQSDGATEISVESTSLSSEPLPLPRTSTSSSTRKRCPQCNATYNSPLIAYCAYHIVPLVDIDAPVDVSPIAKRVSPLLWFLIIVTFAAAAFAAYLLFSPFNWEDKKTATPVNPSSPPDNVGKGIPVAGGDLRGKAVVLHEAEAPLKPKDDPVKVLVRVKVDKTGHVYSARSSSKDDQWRQAAIAAARQSVFSVDKLRGRGGEGTITYTFNP